MKIKEKLTDKFNRLTRIYEGNIYELNDDNKLFFSKKNVESKAEKIEKIFYKRSIFTDLYVIELNTKKRIPTLIKNKFIRIPSKKFIIIEKKGLKFEEKQIENKNIKKTYKINEKNNIFSKTKIILNTMKLKTLKVYKNIIEKKYSFSKNKINLKSIKLKIIEFFGKLIEKKNKLLQKKDEIKKDKQEIKLLGSGEKINSNTNVKNRSIEKNFNNEKNGDDNEIITKPNKQEKDESLQTNNEKIIDVDYKNVKSNNMTKKFDRNSQIKELKETKNEILCDYWMKKQYPKKEIVTLNNNNNDITKIAKEMISISNDTNIIKQNLNNIKLSTQILKTEKEIIAYYNFKLTGNKELFTEDVKTNCYKMLRVDRKLKR